MGSGLRHPGLGTAIPTQQAGAHNRGPRDGLDGPSTPVSGGEARELLVRRRRDPPRRSARGGHTPRGEPDPGVLDATPAAAERIGAPTGATVSAAYADCRSAPERHLPGRPRSRRVEPGKNQQPARGPTAEQRRGLRIVDLVLIRPSQDIGRLAAHFEVRLPRFFRHLLRSAGARETTSPDLLSLLMFDPEYLKALMEIGEADAEARADDIDALLDGAAAP